MPDAKHVLVIGEHTRIRPRKMYRVVRWGRLPDSDKRGVLLVDFYGRQVWKSQRVLVSLKREKRIVERWEV